MTTRKSLEEVLLGLSVEVRYRWCHSDQCFCMGCVNGEVARAGYTEEDWSDWVRANPRPESSYRYSEWVKAGA